MAYEIWNGMLIFNVVIITVNLRILNMSSQLSLLLVMLCSFGVVTYYVMFFLIEILFYTEVKNTLTHQITTWMYWVLIALYVFAVEGIYHLSTRWNYVGLKIKHLKTQKTFNKEL